MAKRRRKRRREPVRGQRRRSGPALVRLSNPFAGVPQDELIAAFVKAGNTYAKEFEESLGKLQTLLVSVDPVQLLSTLATYGLSASVTDSGRVQKKNEMSSIGQHHVELLQALALRIPEEQLVSYPISPDKVQETWDLLIALSTAFDRKRYSEAANAKSSQDKAVMLVQEHLRLNTQCVRNWGYFRPVVSIIKELYRPLDPYFLEEASLEATSLVRTFECLVGAIETRINEHVGRLSPAMQARTLGKVVAEYCRAFPELRDRPEDLTQFSKGQRLSLNSAKAFFFCHAELFLRDLFIFSVPDISEMTGLDATTLRRALPRFSLSFGDLNEHRPDHFFLDNPVWTKPLIRVEEDRYCCLLPQSFFNFAIRILDGLLASSEIARSTCARRRASFLEDQVERLIRSAFPHSIIQRNFVWRDEDKDYETDLIARIDSYLLIVEAKSGAVSWPALRGAPLRTRQHIEELFIEPAKQSQRLARKVQALLSPEENRGLLQALLPFDASGIREIVRLSVSLEDLAGIQTNLPALRETGWLPGDLESAPTMSLADIQVVLETLSGVPERLHYLVRRGELERNMRYFGDEIDLLGLYLDTGFNFATIEFGGDEMVLSGMSQPIDDYYEACDRGIARKKPVLKSTRWWLDIRRQIEKRAPPRWSEAAVMLLNVSYAEQEKMEKMFKKIVKKVKKSRYQPSYIDSVTLQPSTHRKDAFAIMAFREQAIKDRHKKMENLASKVFEASHVGRCLIIGVNVDRTEYPYSMLGVFDRGSDKTPESKAAIPLAT